MATSNIHQMMTHGFRQSGSGTNWAGDAYFDAIGSRVYTPSRIRWNWGQLFPVNAAVLAAPNMGGQNNGTVTTPTQASTNFMTQSHRTQFASSAAINSSAGTTAASAMCWLSTTPRVGGFMFFTRFAPVTNTTGNRAFVGVASVDNVCGTSGNLGTAGNIFAVGIGFDSSDANTGTWSFFANNGASKAKVALTNMARTANNVWEMWMWADPGTAEVTYWVYDLSGDAEDVPVTTYSTAANLPTNKALYPQANLNTGTSTSAVTFNIMRYGVYMPI